MSEKNIKIEENILRSFFNLRKKILSDQEYSENIRTGWTRGSLQNKFILKSVSKPKLLNKLFFLVVDDNFWEQLSLEDHETLSSAFVKKAFFIELIYIINGLNPTNKTLDELIKYVIHEIKFKEYWLSGSKEISYRKINVIEEGFSGLIEPLLSLLKDTREYLEAISVIWKWNSITDENKKEDYAINNFTLHGLEKIIRNKPQSVRNLFGQLAKESSEGKVDELESKIHEFIKPNKYFDSLKPKKISTLKTEQINNFLQKDGYATSNYWTHFADYKIAQDVIKLKTSSKKNFNKLITGVGFNSNKVKMICFGEFAERTFLPRIHKDLKNAEPILKDSPFGNLVSLDNIFWPNDANNQLYKSIHELGKYSKFSIDQRFLEVCSDIENYGIEIFYSEKKIQKLSYFDRPFKSLYEDNKEDFIKVLELISNIQEELEKIDHLVITCNFRSGLKLQDVSNLITIANHISKLPTRPKKIITTCIILNLASFIEDLKKKYQEENEKLIDEIKNKCDSIIRFDQNKFIETQEGSLSSVENKINGHDSSEYEIKIENMIGDELLDIFNNIIVLNLNLSNEDYAYYMGAGATIIGKYIVYDNNKSLGSVNKAEIEKEIEKKYNYLIHESYDIGREYRSCGRLMVIRSKISIPENTKNVISELKMFNQEGSNNILKRGAFPDEDNRFLTLTFIQT